MHTPMQTQTQTQTLEIQIPSIVYVELDGYHDEVIIVNFEKGIAEKVEGDVFLTAEDFYEHDVYEIRNPRPIRKVVANLIKWYGIDKDGVIKVRKRNIEFLEMVIKKFSRLVEHRYYDASDPDYWMEEDELEPWGEEEDC